MSPNGILISEALFINFPLQHFTTFSVGSIRKGYGSAGPIQIRAEDPASYLILYERYVNNDRLIMLLFCIEKTVLKLVDIKIK